VSGASGPAEPRQPRVFAVYAFDSAHDSLTAERLLKGACVSARAIPKPRTLGGGCGIALRVEPADAALAEELLVRNNVEWTANGEIVDY
jgi:hypothetical protein